MKGGKCHFFSNLKGMECFFLSGLGVSVILPNLKRRECNFSQNIYIQKPVVTNREDSTKLRSIYFAHWSRFLGS